MSGFRKTFDRLRGKPHLSSPDSKTENASGKPEINWSPTQKKKPKHAIKTVSAKDRAVKVESFTQREQNL
jgi:hypothetical protein